MPVSKQQRVQPRIVVTPGEPAGIGPDIVLTAAQAAWPVELVAVADADLLEQRARHLKLPVKITRVETLGPEPEPAPAGELKVLHQALLTPAVAGQLDVRNAAYVLDCLRGAADACLDGRAAALVTGPIQKSLVIESGIEFSGHTEFLALRAKVKQVVMMLASERMRVALLTTHLPLRAVPDAISTEKLRAVLGVLYAELQQKFAIENPVIGVCGLNPHAGEGGHMGREDAAIIAPCLEQLRGEGMQLLGPLPADTAFTPKVLQRCDAMLAMYHDQGLPVIKYASFGETVNVTLGLPFIRTSVDHGTALDIAGSADVNDKADARSLMTALQLAITLSANAAAS